MEVWITGMDNGFLEVIHGMITVASDDLSITENPLIRGNDPVIERD